jgi:small subunit ribosomal protein S6
MPETQIAGAGAREYETIYVLRPDVTRENAERIATRVEEVVGREQGKLTSVETWGRRQLAYEVARHRRGVYVYLKYLGGGPLVSELERNLRMQDDVLKYQTVLVRKDVDTETVSVNPDDVKFEAIEPPAEGEEQEMTLERSLGLEPSPEGERGHHGHHGGDDYEDDPMSDFDDEREED